MKPPFKFLLGATILAGAQLSLMTGCVGGGYVEASSGPAYYGDGPWIDNTVIVEGRGRGWYGDHRDRAYVHPDNHPAPRRDVHVDSHPGHDRDDHHR